jgi:lipopolysaccharide/colanic/teichoic acid biosynthesis glycosyltransferase
MSLVGPRPYVPEESETFKPPFTLRFNVIPGMTGPWQVTGRSNLSFEQLCHLEMDYVTQWTLALDATLLFKTIPCVLLKKGAY